MSMATNEKKEAETSNEEALSFPIIPNLPQEIIVVEILIRLPFKFLIRFRSVSKYWNSLISSDPQFATLQFKNSLANNNKFDRRRVLIRNAYSTLFLKTSTNGFEISKLCDPTKGISKKRNSIVAYCDGLVCIGIENNAILFWNPFTGETKRVLEPPPKSFRYCAHPFFIYGLGFDKKTNDYKLVRIFWLYYYKSSLKVGNEVQVYSLRHNSWRQIQHLPIEIEFLPYEEGVSVNGALHWATYTNANTRWKKKVFSFDLAEEKYRLLDVPMDMPFNIMVGVLDEKLCVCYQGHWVSEVFWLIDKYENVESWTTCIDGDRGIPLCLLTNDEVLLRRKVGGDLTVYNFKDQTFRDLKIHGIPDFFHSITILETLISPNTFDGINSN